MKKSNPYPNTNTLIISIYWIGGEGRKPLGGKVVKIVKNNKFTYIVNYILFSEYCLYCYTI